MKKLFIFLFIIPLLITSYSTSAAISTEGYFYKVKYYEDGLTKYALRGAYSDLESCNEARSNATSWAEHEFVVMGFPCTLFYSDDYNAIGDTQDLWGISPVVWIGLSNAQKDQLAERIKVIKPAYNLQGYIKEVQQALDDVVKSSQAKRQ